MINAMEKNSAAKETENTERWEVSAITCRVVKEDSTENVG